VLRRLGDAVEDLEQTSGGELAGMDLPDALQACEGVRIDHIYIHIYVHIYIHI